MIFLRRLLHFFGTFFSHSWDWNAGDGFVTINTFKHGIKASVVGWLQSFRWGFGFFLLGLGLLCGFNLFCLLNDYWLCLFNLCLRYFSNFLLRGFLFFLRNYLFGDVLQINFWVVLGGVLGLIVWFLLLIFLRLMLLLRLGFRFRFLDLWMVFGWEILWFELLGFFSLCFHLFKFHLFLLLLFLRFVYLLTLRFSNRFWFFKICSHLFLCRRWFNWFALYFRNNGRLLFLQVFRLTFPWLLDFLGLHVIIFITLCILYVVMRQPRCLVENLVLGVANAEALFGDRWRSNLEASTAVPFVFRRWRE